MRSYEVVRYERKRAINKVEKKACRIRAYNRVVETKKHTKEYIKLNHEWRLKLKKTGFKDIEMFSNAYSPQPTFMDNLNRCDAYKTRSLYGQADWYRIMSLCGYHADWIKPMIREVLIEWGNGLSLPQSIKKLGNGATIPMVHCFVSAHRAKMINFVNSLEEDL